MYNARWIATEMIKDAPTPSMSSSASVCRGCQEGKTAQKPFPSNLNKHYYDSFELLHFELCGSMEQESLYIFFLIVDEACECMKSFCLRANSDKEILWKRTYWRPKHSLERKYRSYGMMQLANLTLPQFLTKVRILSSRYSFHTVTTLIKRPNVL